MSVKELLRQRSFILGASSGLLFGMFFWIFDSFMDAFYFYEGSFISIFISNIPSHELYIRISVLFLSGLFGSVMGLAYAWYYHKLRLSRDWYEQTLQSMGDGVIATDSTGNVREMNPVAESLTGWSAEKAKGKQLNQIFSISNAGTGEIVDNPVALVMLTGEIQGLANDTVLTAKDGTRYQIADSAAPIRKLNGEIDGVVLIFRNITDAYHQQHQLKENKEKLDIIFNSIGDPLFIHDMKGNFLEVNEAAAEKLGYSKEELLGMSVQQIDAPENAEVASDFFQKLQEEGQLFIETNHLDKFGNRIPVELNSRMIQFNGEPAILSSARDISRQRVRLTQLRQYEKLVQGSDDLIAVGNNEYIYTLVNPKYAAFYGKPPEEIVGAHIRDIIGKDVFEERVKARLDKCLKGDTQTYEIIRNSPEFGERILWARYYPVPADREGEYYVAAVITDITERKKAEQALVESEQKYRELVETTPDAIFINVKNEIIYANNACVNLLEGKTVNEFLGRSPLEFIHPAHHEKFNRVIQHILETQEKPPVTEVKMRSLHGHILSAELTASSFVHGNRPGIMVILRDITDRIQAQSDRQLLYTAIEQAAEAIVITDTAPVIQYVNPAFEKITGYNRDEALGRNPSILSSGEHSLEFYQNMWETITSGQTWEGQFINRRKDGSVYFEEVTISPILDDVGKITHYVGVKSDITQERELEEQFRQAQKMEAVGQLAGGVAHDFNNLLTIIGGYSDMLNSQLPQGGPKEMLSSIIQASERAQALTRQLLAFSRKQTLSPEIVEPNNLIERYLKMLERLISEDISLQFEPGEGVKPIYIDAGQLEQVLMNLTVNARDAMPQGGKILIRSFMAGPANNLEMNQNGQEYVGISVADSGVGMDEQIQARIFDPFFTTKEQGKGTGLGLSTVHGIVKQSGGDIQLKSRPGIGTTFTLYFPVTQKKPKKSVQFQSEEPERSLINAKVLIVDDDPGILTFIERVLTAKQYSIVSHHSAEDAVASFQEEPEGFDLVLTDVVLTGKSGIELANICKNIRNDIPVIFMSGYPTDKLEEYIQEKAVTMLTKPFQPAQLYSVIENELLNRTKQDS